MRKWLRRVRGAIGMGLTWAGAWFGAGMLLLLVVGPDAADVPFPVGSGMFGFLAGTTFSTILGIMEGRRRFDEMSVPRFAGLGAFAGLLFSMTLGAALGLAEELLVLGPAVTLAGAVSAAGTLALAKKAEEHASVAAAADVADVALREDEAPETARGVRLRGDGDGPGRGR